MFTLFSSGAVNGTYLTAVGAIITQVGPGSFQATVATSGARQFYRISRAAVLPRIQSIRVSGGTVTIGFTSGPSDTASMFTLLSSGAVNGTYLTAAGAIITQVGPGSFQATVATSGARQFYLVSR